MDNKVRYIEKISRNFEIYRCKRLKEEAMNSNELLALHYIRHHEGCFQEDIVSYLEVDKALITRIIKKLNNEGLIIKEVDESDKRKNHLFSTSKANDYKISLTNIENEFYSYLFSEFEEDELETFFNTLEKIYLKSKKLRKGNYDEIKK